MGFVTVENGLYEELSSEITKGREGIQTKKIILLMLFCFTLILSACSQGEEDKQGFSGVISDGDTMGYEYTVTKEQRSFSWKVGYRGDTTIIKESTANKNDLENFRTAVNDSKEVLGKLIISVSYFLIVIITTLTLYKKKRKMLKEVSVVIAVLAGFAFYIAVESSFDLNSSLRDAKHYYLILTK
ncbi:geobacillin-26 family protein [Sutcliffiella halmapala]|uniref:geobacillin-26 family protein n=1 Tax=Sutcliffiella halmapala TaxID=79882 RepID=UPI00099581F4|nr:geobacillin-26 family protein [Sutcliffiella halmapala]